MIDNHNKFKTDGNANIHDESELCRHVTTRLVMWLEINTYVPKFYIANKNNKEIRKTTHPNKVSIYQPFNFHNWSLLLMS